MDIIDTFKTALGFKAKKNDDIFDRLNSRYTMSILVVFAAMVTLFLLGDDPITCWFPVHFHDSHSKFANSYCWVKNTYYLPFHENIPRKDESDKRQMVTYYQWIPFILLAQALMFKLPGIFWNSLNSKAGLDADDIMVSAGKLNQAVNEERRGDILDILTMQLDRFLGGPSPDRTYEGKNKCKYCLTACCHCCGRRFGTFLVMLYLITKLLYIGNLIFQILILNHVLSISYSNYGLELLKGGMTSDHDWQNSPLVAFPRVTMCDIDIRRLGNVQRYTLQCTLPMNLFNEKKIYIFLWFWFMFVLILSGIGFFMWFIRCVAKKDQRVFLMNHLGCGGRIVKHDFNDELYIDQFINDYLRQDGMFLLRLISHNTNNMTTRDIIGSLYDCWVDKRKAEQVTWQMPPNKVDEMTLLANNRLHKEASPI